jgi:hypothetical protein
MKPEDLAYMIRHRHEMRVERKDAGEDDGEDMDDDGPYGAVEVSLSRVAAVISR